MATICESAIKRSLNVIRSCKSIEQLDIARRYAKFGKTYQSETVQFELCWQRFKINNAGISRSKGISR